MGHSQNLCQLNSTFSFLLLCQRCMLHGKIITWASTVMLKVIWYASVVCWCPLITSIKTKIRCKMINFLAAILWQIKRHPRIIDWNHSSSLLLTWLWLVEKAKSFIWIVRSRKILTFAVSWVYPRKSLGLSAPTLRLNFMHIFLYLKVSSNFSIWYYLHKLKCTLCYGPFYGPAPFFQSGRLYMKIYLYKLNHYRLIITWRTKKLCMGMFKKTCYIMYHKIFFIFEI